MAYSGSTAASSVANPPRLLVGQMASIPGTTGLSTTAATQHQQGGQLWFYSSTNLTTDVFVSNFFTDGKALGMRPGDLVLGNQFSSAGSSVQTFFGTVTGVSTSGATLSTGASLTSTHA